ncbi:MAG: hypothetical protein PHO44_03190 [Sphaerochaetaceae bacterium]|nr:hypothetical protein [Sphaerochaetaceae bacterium]MDD3162744.1 hypothetical protein [Sphaerochaetaceae bacterium]MDD4006964.1 hypothetical protein [Sphaerochaetaceae bacterium]MDD4396071.1 hypothetical protein [Sphaerochaetaceae bacterium]
MAIKKEIREEETSDNSLSSAKARVLFNTNSRPAKENKILTTFSIEPSFKKELEELFSNLGLGWAAGIRFALKEFYKKYNT